MRLGAVLGRDRDRDDTIPFAMDLLDSGRRAGSQLPAA